MNEHTELLVKVYDEWKDITRMVKDLNQMCGTDQRPDLAQLQAIRDTLEQFRFSTLTNTPLEYQVIN